MECKEEITSACACVTCVPTGHNHVIGHHASIPYPLTSILERIRYDTKVHKHHAFAEWVREICKTLVALYNTTLIVLVMLLDTDHHDITFTL